MKIIFLLITVLIQTIAFCQNPLDYSKRVNGTHVRQALEKQVAHAYQSLVKVTSNNEAICSGVIINSNGFILTKASELPEHYQINLADGSIYECVLVGTDEQTDLALLKIDLKGLVPLKFIDSVKSETGNWLISALPSKKAKIGIKSTPNRSITKISGVMGVILGDGTEKGVPIKQSINEGPAHSAGIRHGDTITKINNINTVNRDDVLKALKGIGPGQKISMQVRRQNKITTKKITLGDRHITFGMFNRNLEMSGNVSTRVDDFQHIIQHDIALTPEEIPSPLFNIEGQLIGLNIAKVNRSEFFALPSRQVNAAMTRLLKNEVPRHQLRPKSQTVSLDEFKQIQKQLKTLLPQAKKTTVGILSNGASGSGVLVSEDGYILSAAHISSTPNSYIKVFMPDGRIYEAESLGRHPKADLGLIKITEKNIPKLPFSSIGQSSKARQGDWCFALGHPNGFKADRGAVLRIGKLIDIRAHLLWSDCTLLGGDSGGPLFNFKGEVIGIHSRIFNTSEDNIHGPADIYLKHWQEFCQAKTISDAPQVAFLGVTTSSKGLGARVVDIVAQSAADRAGLKVGDIILSIDQNPTINTQELISILKTKKVGQQIKLQLTRAGDNLEIDATLGQRPLIIK